MLFLIIGILVILVIAILCSGYKKAPPDTAFIISGMRKKIIIGKASVKIPFLERMDRLSLKLIAIDVKTTNAVPTADYINIQVDAAVNVKISSEPAKLALAAENFLNQALAIRERRVPEYSFDKEGNMSFGISDYTDFEGMKYDPEIGIFGMDINVVLRRPGNRITQRALLKRRVPKKHRVDRDEAIQYMKDKFEVEVVQ